MNADEIERLTKKMCTESDFWIDKLVAGGEPAARRLLEVMGNRTTNLYPATRDLAMSRTIALHRLAKVCPDVILTMLQERTVMLNVEIAIALRECGDPRLEVIAKEALQRDRF